MKRYLAYAASASLACLLCACSGSGNIGQSNGQAITNADAIPHASALAPDHTLALSQDQYTAADSLMQSDAAGLKINQTAGFGAGRLLLFTYQQQFDCVIEPRDDPNYSGKPAALDPSQFASPECQVGAPSSIDPSGAPVAKTDKLFVLVPFFETNKRKPAFTPALGKALKKLFGLVPDAFKDDPGVAVQCPAPKDKPGTCTMHPLTTDLGPVLTALKLLPPKTTLYVPLVNHSHLLANGAINQMPEWWQVVVDLVTSPSAWPNAKGTKELPRCVPCARLKPMASPTRTCRRTSSYFLALKA